MLIFGLLDRCGEKIEQSEIDELARAISRHPSDRPQQFVYPGFALTCVNPGLAPGALSISADSESLVAIAGRAYLAPAAMSAMDEANAIRESLDRQDNSILREACGSYSGVYFDARSNRAQLFVDKIGVVPLYYATNSKRIYFASALRMLEGISELKRTHAIDHIAELLAFGCCLGSGTPFQEIHSLYSGEILELSSQGCRPSRYWNWDDIAARSYGSPDELIDEIDNVFEGAIRTRLDEFDEAVAFLSGGLDSRVIAAKLRGLGREVWSLNCAPALTEDAEFGRMAAESLGTRHFHQTPQPGTFLAAQTSVVTAWQATFAQEIDGRLQPHRVWAGEGGSVGMGHVYLNQRLIELCRKSSIEQACRHFMNEGRRKAPSGIFRRELRQQAESAPLDGMLNELRQYKVADPGALLLRFLLHNDQRRHLHPYYEDLDIIRFERITPFFDARLLELIISAPIDWFLYHRLYNRWLTRFGPSVCEVPWQHYPGHEPPPMTHSDERKLRNQWADDRLDDNQRKANGKRELATFHDFLTSNRFPGTMLDRRKLWAAYLVTKLGIKDYRYAFEAALTINRFSPSDPAISR